MKQIIDNFSTGAADYAAYRPESPKKLFDFLYSHVAAFVTAWDCGTGNGQVAVKLAERFQTVYGTDISQEQLHNAQKRGNIIYKQERAEHTTFPDHSIDIITIGQALHWFDFDDFYKEVKRVGKPGALIAAWTYSQVKVTPAVDKVIDHLYWDITRKYWDKERDYVDAEYKTIPFPFDEIVCPTFSIVKRMPMPQLLGYLRTWSGVKHYIAKEQRDPVLQVLTDLEKAWGAASEVEILWPVHVRAGYIK